jgi:hypothetical protein
MLIQRDNYRELESVFLGQDILTQYHDAQGAVQKILADPVFSRLFPILVRPTSRAQLR